MAGPTTLPSGAEDSRRVTGVGTSELGSEPTTTNQSTASEGISAARDSDHSGTGGLEQRTSRGGRNKNKRTRQEAALSPPDNLARRARAATAQARSSTRLPASAADRLRNATTAPGTRPVHRDSDTYTIQAPRLPPRAELPEAELPAADAATGQPATASSSAAAASSSSDSSSGEEDAAS